MEIKKNPKPIAIASYSAGTVILRLTPGEEKVALVLNILSQERMIIPKELAGRREYHNRVLEDRGENVVVSFDQRAGLGTPFGKEEPEDNGNRRITAERETLEETGAPIGDRIIESISHTEKPNQWSSYTNTVFLANGIGFEFNRDNINDPNVNPKYSRFYPLLRLPFYGGHVWRKIANEHKPIIGVGTYHAAIRRIVSVLLQLDRPLLQELGRPGTENAEDLARALIGQYPFMNFFSQRMIKALMSVKREDLILDRLAHLKHPLHHISQARYIGRNLILWLSDDALDQALELLLNQADRAIRSGPKGLERFLGECLVRKESPTRTVIDRRLGESTDDFLDREPTETDEDDVGDYERMWLALDEIEPKKQEVPRQTSPEGGTDMIKAKTPTFFACIGLGRTCGKSARPNELTCDEHAGERQVRMPSKVLIRMHFSRESSFGGIIVDELLREGVPLVERTKTRQEELELKRMMATGIRVFGDEDLGPNAIVKHAAGEMEYAGYVLANVHVLSLDEIFAERNSDKVGSRTVVFAYEYGAKAITPTDTAKMLLEEPFMSCRVWVNLVDSAGTQLHAVELTAYQHGHPAHHELRFANSVWAFKELPRPEKPNRSKP